MVTTLCSWGMRHLKNTGKTILENMFIFSSKEVIAFKNKRHTNSPNEFTLETFMNLYLN